MAQVFRFLMIKLDSEDSAWRIGEGMVNMPIILPPTSYVLQEPLVCVGWQLTHD